MPPSKTTAHSNHFEGKKALKHVVKKHSDGIAFMAEAHGTEIPGHISAFTDSAKETATILLLFGIICYHFSILSQPIFIILTIFSCGIIAWKTGRSACLGWFRIEKLHRIIEQERWEIQHQRPQEREELYALYKPKGFEGELLEEIVDVLMADDNRLLKVMLEEEMGFRLECHEHPLKQGFGAGLGSFFSSLFCLLGTYLFSLSGLLSTVLFVVGITALLSAVYEKNRIIPAIVWNIALVLLSSSLVYFTLEFISP